MYRKWTSHTQMRASSMDDEMIHAFIIDRNVAWREAIDTLLERQPDMVVVGTSPDLNSAYHHLQKLRPDVVLIDRLPSSENERALHDYLSHTIPHMCFILHSCSRKEAVISELGEGCSTKHLPKGSSPKKIVEFVREACNDHFQISGTRENPAN